jgi:hypothetical protein
MGGAVVGTARIVRWYRVRVVRFGGVEKMFDFGLDGGWRWGVYY